MILDIRPIENQQMNTLGKNKKSGLFGVPGDLWRCLKTAIVRSGKEGGTKEGIRCRHLNG